MFKASKKDEGNSNATRQIKQTSSSKSDDIVNQKENLNKIEKNKKFEEVSKRRTKESQDQHQEFRKMRYCY